MRNTYLVGYRWAARCVLHLVKKEVTGAFAKAPVTSTPNQGLEANLFRLTHNIYIR